MQLSQLPSRGTIHEASERDFKIVVAADAISGLYRRGEEALRAIGASVLTTDECLAWFPESAGSPPRTPSGPRRESACAGDR